jgi:hypothetical protein
MFTTSNFTRKKQTLITEKNLHTATIFSHGPFLAIIMVLFALKGKMPRKLCYQLMSFQNEKRVYIRVLTSRSNGFEPDS